MEVTVLTIPRCPNSALMEERLAAAAEGLPDVRVTRRIVADEHDADALGMRGSPTLLIDGTDPFPAPGAAAGLSCRLYPQEDGSMAGAPPATALRRALSGDGRA